MVSDWIILAALAVLGGAVYLLFKSFGSDIDLPKGDPLGPERTASRNKQPTPGN